MWQTTNRDWDSFEDGGSWDNGGEEAPGVSGRGDEAEVVGGDDWEALDALRLFINVQPNIPISLN